VAEEAREIPSQVTRTDRRREVVRIERNLRKRRLAFALIGVLLLAIVGILLAGYVIIFVRPPQQLVVRVNDVEYTRGDMVELLRVRQRGMELSGSNLNTSTDVFQALQLMVENEIIAQTAPNLGITVSDEEVDAQIRASMDFLSGGASAGMSQAQLDREFGEMYGSYLNSIQISEEEHRQMVRRSLLREKVRQFVGESVPRVVEQRHVYRLVVFPNDEIDIMQTKYKDATENVTDPQQLAEAFKNITREFSRDSAEMVRRGGNLGWVPQGVLDDYDDIIWGLDYGELSQPTSDLDNPGRMLVFMVSEHDEAHKVAPEHLEALKNRALQDWINEQRQENEVYAVFNSDIYSWVVDQLGISSTITPTPQSNDPLQQIMGGGGF
jgi:hypothetical protein